MSARGELRRGLWIVVACVLVSAGGGWFLAQSQPPRYEARALLRVNDPDLDRAILGLPAERPIERATSELAADFDDDRTAARAVERLPESDFALPSEIQQRTVVELDQDTGLVSVIASARTPAAAVRLANAYAYGFVDLRRARDLRRIASVRLAVERRLAADGPEGRLATDEGPALATRASLLRVLEGARTSSIAVQRAATDARLGGAAPHVSGLVGAGLGALLGFGLVGLRGSTDLRVRDRELAAALGTSLLVEVPSESRLARRGGFAALAPEEAEPFRLLVARLDAAAPPPLVLLVAGFDRIWRPRRAAAHLAGAAAAAGYRTLLVDPDAWAGSEASAPSSDRVERTADGFDVLRAAPDPGSSPRGDRQDAADVAALLGWALASHDAVLLQATRFGAGRVPPALVRAAGRVVAVGPVSPVAPERIADVRDAVVAAEAEVAAVVLTASAR